MNITIKYLDVCPPGYFQGFPGPVLCASVDGSTVIGELWEDLERDLDSICLTYAQHMEVVYALKDVFGKESDQGIAFPELPVLPEDGDDEELIYAYFGIVGVEL